MIDSAKVLPFWLKFFYIILICISFLSGLVSIFYIIGSGLAKVIFIYSLMVFFVSFLSLEKRLNMFLFMLILGICSLVLFLGFYSLFPNGIQELNNNYYSPLDLLKEFNIILNKNN